MVLRWVGGGLLAIAAIGFFALHPLFKRYRVPSESMQPTITLGEIVNLNAGADPEVGAVVVFHPPTGAATTECGVQPVAGQSCAKPTADRDAVLFIKRIVAGPGDRVAFVDGYTIRNGTKQNEPYAADCNHASCTFPKEITVPDGMYFMAGDNRGASDDSRFWGPVPRDWIIGRAERCEAVYFLCSPVS
jgi:signal peptidase I